MLVEFTREEMLLIHIMITPKKNSFPSPFRLQLVKKVKAILSADEVAMGTSYLKQGKPK